MGYSPTFHPVINEYSRRLVGETEEPRWNILYDRHQHMKEKEDKQR